LQDLTSQRRREIAITAAALQDHMARSLDALCYDPRKARCSGRAPTNSRSTRGRRRAGDKGLHERDGQEEEEYVLDPDPPRLTLAQRMGLVTPPPRRLTEDEWTRVKARSTEQGESAQPCAICREEFHLQPQVLLSCSHVFHRACLRAFEKYSGRKCCAMCRKEQYETRVIYDGARHFRNRCATRIQAFWRGYVARKWYRNARKTICPKDKDLRRKFFEAKLQELNDSFVRYCHTDVEAFLSDIDRSLSSSRRVFHQLERKHVSDSQESDLDRIQSQVLLRDVQDCPICLTALCRPSTGTKQQGSRRTLLLSCSHLFHQPCLETFEALHVDSRPTCPMCRSEYSKRLL
ncbi:RING finger protein 32, partial [Myripristis murdjan]|uniref:RING finger protein 32 n=1 Tax=Myripristis murdjan TaxID=586833 RepID=UPI0011761E00